MSVSKNANPSSGGGSKNSDSTGSNDPNDSNGPDDFNGPSGGTDSDVSIKGLANALKQYKASGTTDLRLSPEDANKCLKFTHSFIDAMKVQRDRLEKEGLDQFGKAGGLQSANLVRLIMLNNIQGPGGVKDSFKQCLDWAQSLEDLIHHVGGNLLDKGNNG